MRMSLRVSIVAVLALSLGGFALSDTPRDRGRSQDGAEKAPRFLNRSEGNSENTQTREQRRDARRRLMEAMVADSRDAEAPEGVVTVPADFALKIDGDFSLEGSIFKAGVPLLHTDEDLGSGNTALGAHALTSLTVGDPAKISGINNSAFGYDALRYTTSGRGNVAVGSAALKYNTTGYLNTAVGLAAMRLNVAGQFNTAIGTAALRSNSIGYSNVAVGVGAMVFNTEGFNNVAIGTNALLSNSTGESNTATGTYAMWSNDTGRYNVANGYYALGLNTMGSGNTALGELAMLYNIGGSANTAIGSAAGAFWEYGNYNIALGYGAYGKQSDSGVIRIGGGGYQTSTYIEGINGASSSDKSGFDSHVCIDSFDQLGPCQVKFLSSSRFKEAIDEMGETRLASLRPVTFKYKEGFYQDTENLQYGLLAEEVAEVFPGLVTYDEEGRPNTVRYDLLAPLLLNEVQQQRAELSELRDVKADLAALRREVAALTRQRE